MKYSDFEDDFLIAAYKEWVVGTGVTSISSGDILASYPLAWRPGWVHQLVADLGQRGFLRGKGVMGGENDQPIMLTANGMKAAERLLDGGRDINRVAIDLPIEDAVSSEIDRAVAVIDSEQWTGIQRRLQSDLSLVETIRSKMLEVDRLVEKASLSNVERQKAKAISEALIKLVESPEPEWRVVVGLLNAGPLTAALNVAALAQLILKLIFGIG